MRKTFSLHQDGKDDARVLDAVRLDVRKYVKRERRKTPPAGFTLWQFHCRVGTAAETATVLEVDDVVGAIEIVAASGAPSVYVEILAEAGNRPPKPEPETPPLPPA